MNISLVLVFVGVCVAVAGQMLLKTGMNQVGRIGSGSLAEPGATVLRVVTNPVVMAGLALYVVSAVLWLIVLSREELSFVYPLIGLSYVLVVLLSKFYFHEDVGWLRWVGVVLVSLGVVLVTRS